jgi:hypothetical protein
VVPRLLFAAALVEVLDRGAQAERRSFAVVRRPFPAAARRNLKLLPWPLPAAPLVVHRRNLIVSPGRYPRRCSLCAAAT